MAIFWNIFLKTSAIFISIVLILFLSASLINYLDKDKKEDFLHISGDANSTNIIAIIELNGAIINNINQFSEFINPFIISPNLVEQYLDDLKKISPKVIIFSINSPGGTVSASKNLYEIITNFKINNNTKIIFHSNEILASGAYWASTSADKIYASYGAVIGSIGVKGPDWFFYDKPISISNSIFGNQIETKDGIKVFKSIAGKSKDIFNPFRQPTEKEINQFQNMVDEIYYDFVRIVSKERKIEMDTIINDIGAIIYNSETAMRLHLIDDEINLNNLIKKTISKNKYDNYKVIKLYKNSNSFLTKILNSNLFKTNSNRNIECLTLRSSLSVILSYESIGC